MMILAGVLGASLLSLMANTIPLAMKASYGAAQLFVERNMTGCEWKEHFEFQLTLPKKNFFHDDLTSFTESKHMPECIPPPEIVEETHDDAEEEQDDDGEKSPLQAAMEVFATELYNAYNRGMNDIIQLMPWTLSMEPDASLELIHHGGSTAPDPDLLSEPAVLSLSDDHLPVDEADEEIYYDGKEVFLRFLEDSEDRDRKAQKNIEATAEEYKSFLDKVNVIQEVLAPGVARHCLRELIKMYVTADESVKEEWTRLGMLAMETCASMLAFGTIVHFLATYSPLYFRTTACLWLFCDYIIWDVVFHEEGGIRMEVLGERGYWFYNAARICVVASAYCYNAPATIGTWKYFLLFLSNILAPFFIISIIAQEEDRRQYDTFGFSAIMYFALPNITMAIWFLPGME